MERQDDFPEVDLTHISSSYVMQIPTEAWQTIRAELTRLTEIADSVDPLVVRLGEVTTRLEAANALLREIMEFGEDRRLHIRIQAHLSENGHV